MTYQPTIDERLLEVDVQITATIKLWSDNAVSNEVLEEAMAAETKKYVSKYIAPDLNPFEPWIVESTTDVSVIVRDAT